MLYESPAIERLGIPEYNWWNEALHGVARAGVATVFPQAIGLAATFDTDLIEKIGDVVSTEGRGKFNEFSKKGDHGIYKGLTFWAPNVNIFRDPRWGRGHETYGEDPYLTGKLGCAYIRGLQGDDPDHLKSAACAKHFAVHSGPEKERHHFDAKATRKDMWETYLPAFQACVEAGVESVMGAYNRTNGEPCCANTYLMEEVLRGKWHFEGHYVSDCWAIKDFHENHKVTRNAEENTLVRHPRPCASQFAFHSSPTCSYTLYIIESSSFVFPVRCISRRSALRQPVQHAAPVIAAHWLFCICGFVFFWQQSLFVLAAFFIYVPCLVKSPYQGCVWPYKAF